MQDDEKKLITKEEFNNNVARWSSKIEEVAKANLQMNTRGSGELAKSITSDLGNTEKYPVNRIAFGFVRYGVFRHFGVGRGYVRNDGMVMRGYRVKKGTEMYYRLFKRGYSRKELLQHKVYRETGTVLRKPLNWIDGVIELSISDLADIAGAFYGDKALRTVLENQDRIKIEKR